MTADVAILIVAYNSERQLPECLQSVLDQRRNVRQQIIVLDNASPDRSAEVVREQFPQVTLLQSDRNLGFAGGVNFAARHANAEFLLLLNPDTGILDHAIDTIVEFARAHPGHGLYGGRTFKPNGDLEPSSCWGRPTLWSLTAFAFGLSTAFPKNRFLDPESLGSWPRDTVREVGIVTGCFLLTPATVWRQLGGFDERFFMYGEDADLALRARTAGFRPIICPDARVMHEVGQSSSLPAHKALLLYQGKATLIRTHWKGASQVLALALLTLGVGLRALGRTFRSLLRPADPNDPWISVWNRRKEWLPGYPPLAQPSTPTTSTSASSSPSS
jgi:GT2 family glycosyltransferase